MVEFVLPCCCPKVRSVPESVDDVDSATFVKIKYGIYQGYGTATINSLIAEPTVQSTITFTNYPISLYTFTS